TYEYNPLGIVTRVRDARNHDTQFIVNQRDQVVRTISREVTDGSGIRYQIDHAYDVNDNVAHVDVQNVTEDGEIAANSHFTTTTEYDVLNHPVRFRYEVDADHSIVRETEYDGNRNPIRIRSGEAVNGNQPANEVRIAYDERNLPYRTIRAPGDPGQSTTQTDY